MGAQGDEVALFQLINTQLLVKCIIILSMLNKRKVSFNHFFVSGSDYAIQVSNNIVLPF